MSRQTQSPGTFRYLILSIGTFFVLQAMVIVLHEFTHSTTAWLLGEMKNPFDIVWGNPVIMTCWDEGVDYTQIFKHGDDWQGAIIGFMPIIMHSAAVTVALYLMGGQWLPKRKWLFNIVYWLTVVNLMELIAYVYMRAFSGHGDIGNFDRGMSLSPWWIFLFGSAALTWALWLFYHNALPRLQDLFAKDHPTTAWTILVMTSFLLFLWGSGIRVMAHVSGSQRLFGLIGVVGFVTTVWAFKSWSGTDAKTTPKD